MHAIYRLRADELNEELEKIRHNMVFTEKLQHHIKILDEGKEVVKTIANLKFLANE